MSTAKVDIKSELFGFARFLLSELKPKGELLTLFNVVTLSIMAMTAVILVIRYAWGLGAVTDLDQQFPWGIWIGFDVVTGVAFAGGAYVVCFLAYVLNKELYHPIVRITVLNGFLAYVFYAGALLLDLGRPWNVINPIIGNSFGVSSVLFLVAWHFMLYMMAQLVEFSPAVAEWLGWRRARKILGGMTLGAVILGISLSLLHQSGLGALFLVASSKIHPLWYSEWIPILFVISSIFAGLSVVILEGTLTTRVFAHRITKHVDHERIVRSLSRICAGVMGVYFALEILNFIHGQRWEHFTGGWAWWFLLELSLVAIPAVLFLMGARRNSGSMIRIAAGLTILGILLNRLNISVIAYKWYSTAHYVPTWMEIMVTLGVLSAEIWVIRWVVNRMPVLSPVEEEEEHPLQIAAK